MWTCCSAGVEAPLGLCRKALGRKPDGALFTMFSSTNAAAAAAAGTDNDNEGGIDEKEKDKPIYFNADPDPVDIINSLLSLSGDFNPAPPPSTSATATASAVAGSGAASGGKDGTLDPGSLAAASSDEVSLYEFLQVSNHFQSTTRKNE